MSPSVQWSDCSAPFDDWRHGCSLLCLIANGGSLFSMTSCRNSSLSLQCQYIVKIFFQNHLFSGRQLCRNLFSTQWHLDFYLLPPRTIFYRYPWYPSSVSCNYFPVASTFQVCVQWQTLPWSYNIDTCPLNALEAFIIQVDHWYVIQWP